MWEGFPYFPLRKDFPLAGKESEMPEIAFSGVAPLEGGPFVTSPGSTRESGEPRAKGERWRPLILVLESRSKFRNGFFVS